MPACPVIISPSPVIILFWLAPQFFPQPAMAYGGRNVFISWEKTIRNIEQVATRSLELCKYSHVAWWNRSPQIDQERERKKKKHGHGRCSFSVWDLSEFNTYACTLCLIVIYFNIFCLDLIVRYFIQYSSYLIFLSLKIQNYIDNTSSVLL